MTRNPIGVDLSKDWIDIHDPRRGARRMPNQARDLRAWLASLSEGDLIVIEATSGCDGLLMRLAAQAEQPLHRANPLHAFHFSRSLNRAKTDRVDAAMLARMGAERDLAPTPARDAARAELSELSDRRDQLRRMQTQEKNRLARTTSRAVAADIRANLRVLAGRVARIEAAIADHISTHPELDRDARLLRSIPGIGAVAAVTLLASMPELGQLDRRAAASLGGLAPRARESGKWHGTRYLGDGRRKVRRALYMAALSVLRHRGFDAGRIDRMRTERRPGKVIAIAVARKLLTVANAVLRDLAPFRHA